MPDRILADIVEAAGFEIGEHYSAEEIVQRLLKRGAEAEREACAKIAPELYEALDQLLDDMGEDGLSVCQAAKDQAKAALAKARGETE